MAKMNWDRVRKENLIMRHGSDYGDSSPYIAETANAPKKKGKNKKRGQRICPKCNRKFIKGMISKHIAECRTNDKPKRSRVVVVPVSVAPPKSSERPMQLLREFEDSLRESNLQSWTEAELKLVKQACVSAMQQFQRLMAARDNRNSAR